MHACGGFRPISPVSRDISTASLLRDTALDRKTLLSVPSLGLTDKYVYRCADVRCSIIACGFFMPTSLVVPRFLRARCGVYQRTHPCSSGLRSKTCVATLFRRTRAHCFVLGAQFLLLSPIRACESICPLGGCYG